MLGFFRRNLLVSPNDAETRFKLRFLRLKAAFRWVRLWLGGSTPSQAGYPQMLKYNRMTIRFGKRLTTSSLLFFCSISGLAAPDIRRGEKHADLPVNETVLTSFSDGVPCLRMKVVVQPSQFGGQIPTRIVLATVLNETLHANWQLFNASWAVASNPRVLEEATVQLSEEPPASGTPVEAVFDGLKKSAATYILNLDLRPIEKDGAIGSEYGSAVSDESRAKVAEKLRQKYKDVYKASVDEIVKRGGVRIWQEDVK
jgi:hypothetical protein